MSERQLGGVGMTLDVTADDTYLADAAEMEKLGYSGLWISGGQLMESLDPLAAVIRATKDIPVGSGIIMPDVHGAEAVTALYEEVEHTDPGRLVVGLGAPQQPRQLAPLAGYLDELESGESAVPASRRVLAALGPRKLALARERFTGAVVLLVTPAYVADAKRVLGADRSLIAYLPTVLDTDADRARAAARGLLGFLLGVGGYRQHVARIGFTEDDITNVSDGLVDALVAWGDAVQIADRVEALRAAGADQVVVSATYQEGQPGPIETARQLAAHVLAP